mmetsp:Transcript_21752/g.52597  ORF Transcript_21752/g.52597 Transcript_21752/m.52597 type:complete len:99 (+) Transcript_21752:868-1164(+)
MDLAYSAEARECIASPSPRDETADASFAVGAAREAEATVEGAVADGGYRAAHPSASFVDSVPGGSGELNPMLRVEEPAGAFAGVLAWAARTASMLLGE